MHLDIYTLLCSSTETQSNIQSYIILFSISWSQQSYVFGWTEAKSHPVSFHKRVGIRAGNFWLENSWRVRSRAWGSRVWRGSSDACDATESNLQSSHFLHVMYQIFSWMCKSNLGFLHFLKIVWFGHRTSTFAFSLRKHMGLATYFHRKSIAKLPLIWSFEDTNSRVVSLTSSELLWNESLSFLNKCLDMKIPEKPIDFITFI